MVREPKDNNDLSGGQEDFADQRQCRSKPTRPKGNAAN
jgi:hypothetical protein